jgi:hypothetical protein
MLWRMGIHKWKDRIMLESIEARDLCVGDTMRTGVITDITSTPTGLLCVEVSAYPGSLITNTLTLSPVSVVQVTS